MIISSEMHREGDFIGCGTKAHNLARLKQAGFRVPPFICISSDDLQKPEEIFSLLEKTGIKPPYAVRSSAQAEDGEKQSYAGQFTTFLNVNGPELIMRAGDCFSAKSNFNYSAADQEHTVQSVIIQEMIDGDMSGIMFTKNPMGIISERVIVVGRGMGSNVVADKTALSSYYYNEPDGTMYNSCQENGPQLPYPLEKELLAACEKLEGILSKGLDIEFAIKNNKLYYLQARRITTLSYNNPIILDNSNIVESYPGISCPLTADFVSRQYASIFKAVVRRLSGSDKLSKRYSSTFDHMVEQYNGRMYYHIANWYGVISFLPFSKKILPVWREMLGVSHRDDLPLSYKITGLQRASVALHTLYYFIKAPKKMQELGQDMEKAEALYCELKKDERTLGELRDFYEKTVALIMNKWDYTLINDMYTFIHTGLFRGVMKKRGADEEYLQKAVTDLSYLASLQPVKNLLALALELKRNGKSSAFTLRLEKYIEKYGDRSIGELKLETDTYRENPAMLIKQIEQYAALPDLEQLLLRLEEPLDKEKAKGIGGFFLKMARRGIEGRERSRMDRTRLFGYARSVFLQAGRVLQEQGLIDEHRDVFYLTVDEVFAEQKRDYHSIVAQRKELMKSYGSYPAFSRVIFDGQIVQKPYMADLKVQESAEGLLAGIPCSGGKVRAPVLIVESLESLGDVAGKILLTRATDPGWAFLLASAAGLISEKGSILSHTAIIAREMHVPMIVAVKNAMSQLHNGDEVEMDCSTGFIRLVQPNK